jgi:hypothetical protein
MRRRRVQIDGKIIQRHFSAVVHCTGSKGLFRKKLKKSKNFFENPEHFRKKNDYIGEGTFPPPCTARGGGRFFSKSGNGFPFLVNVLDKHALVW